MSITEFLFNLALLVISFTIPIATTFVLKFVQARTSNEKFTQYLALAEQAVKAAEQNPLFKTGAVKKKAVENYLAEKIGDILSAEDIDNLIEAAVFEINKAVKKITVPDYPQVISPQPSIQWTENINTTTTSGGDST
jgi:hypothetical protein